jgi:hypothetical protein
MPRISEVSAVTARALRSKSGGRVLLSDYVTPGAQNNQVAFAQALADTPVGGILFVDGLFPITASCIVNKAVSVIGGGPSTGFITSDSALPRYHVITVSSSDVFISDLRCSGAQGDLTLGEPSGIHIYDPTSPDAGGVQSYGRIKISGVYVDNCVCGIRVGYQADNTISQIRASYDVHISGCHILDCDDFGVEIFYSQNVIVDSNTIKLRPQSVNDGYPVRGVRYVGAVDGKITNNIIIGPSNQNTAGRGIEAGQAQGYQNPLYLQSASNLHVSGNTISGFYDSVYLSEVRGYAAVVDNVFVGGDDSPTAASAIYCNASSDGMRVNDLFVSGNKSTGKPHFYRGRTNARSIILDGNSHVGAAPASRFAFFDQASTQRIDYLQVTNNTSITNNLATGGTLRIINTKAGEVYQIAGNRLTPSASNGLLSQSGDVVIPPYLDSNIALPTELWGAISA